MVFPVVMYGCESWIVKKAEHRRIDAFELWCWRRLESPLDCKEIQPVHSKGDQSWVFFGRNDAKAETPVLWPPLEKSWLIGKDSDAGRDWGQEEKGTTEDEMAEWHHWLDGREFEWTLGVGGGQGSLACYNSWSRKESDTTEWLNWTELTSKQTPEEEAVELASWRQVGVSGGFQASGKAHLDSSSSSLDTWSSTISVGWLEEMKLEWKLGPDHEGLPTLATKSRLEAWTERSSLPMKIVPLCHCQGSLGSCSFLQNGSLWLGFLTSLTNVPCDGVLWLCHCTRVCSFLGSGSQLMTSE